MKQKNVICVIINVLTYFKDVFDGTSPSWGRSCFFSNHIQLTRLQIQSL